MIATPARVGRVRVVVLPVQNLRQPMADMAVDAIFLGLVEYFMPQVMPLLALGVAGAF